MDAPSQTEDRRSRGRPERPAGAWKRRLRPPCSIGSRRRIGDGAASVGPARGRTRPWATPGNESRSGRARTGADGRGGEGSGGVEARVVRAPRSPSIAADPPPNLAEPPARMACREAGPTHQVRQMGTLQAMLAVEHITLLGVE